MRDRILRPAITILLAALALVPAAWAQAAAPVLLSASFGKPLMPAGKTDLNYLKVSLTGVAVPGARARTPLNLALVIDRSGSMGGGKLENAKEAALALVDRLSDDDILSVVAYDTEASVVVPATRASDRETIRAAIRRIGTGGSTALFAGVSLGAREARKFLDRRRVNRLLLLSDGLANVGPQSPGELAELGASFAKEGISVTTFGLGLGYNEDLMSRLALASDGNHAFIENAADLARIFDAEFGDASSVVARDVRLRVICHGMRPVRALGREARIRDASVEADLLQALAGQERFLLLEVEVPAQPAGTQGIGVSVTAEYTGLADALPGALSGAAQVAFTDRPADCVAAEDKATMVAAVNLLATETLRQATRLRDEGRIEEARKTLLGNSDYLSENAARYGAPMLQTFAVENRTQSEALDESSWNRTRKQMRATQKANATQQTYK